MQYRVHIYLDGTYFSDDAVIIVEADSSEEAVIKAMKQAIDEIHAEVEEV